MTRRGSASDPLWFKDAIVYELHVRTFYDSNGDGIGDFQGLTEKLDYLQDLGITALWLLPFYPSPLKDDGYDIADYHEIHPSYGTLKDFRQFMRAAHDRGIQVITELVVNHTSDQHPWFRAARSAPDGSAKRNYYVWSPTNQRYQDVRIIFTDSEKSNWSWDDEANAYYWHRFFHHQPDLNFDNPRVQRAVLKAMRYWFDMGVDGMRLDAVPYLIEREGTICENLPETHDILRMIRRELDANYENRMLLAEANQWPADVRPYFGDGDECHMAFHFPLMPRIFMALRQEDRHPITEIMRQTPEIPDNAQWALFLRNHDELTLEMVTDEERDYLYQAYAADPQMRINIGIRRRLAPLMENSRRRIDLMNSLLFSLPGTPVIYYGDEIGMGDNIYLGDRNGVRTPMQWTSDRNAGFSRADPARLYAPVIMDPLYGYQAINVEAQQRAPFSLLNWMQRMIALRKQHRTFGRGSVGFLHPRNRTILAYYRALGDETLLMVANLSRSVQPVELDLKPFAGLTPVEMFGSTEFPRVSDAPYFLTLAPYAFFWFRLERAPAAVSARTVQEAAPPAEEMPALFAGEAWDTLLQGNVRTLIERDYLLPFLRQQRWFGGKARTLAGARFVDWTILTRGAEPSFLTVVEASYADGGRETYFVPLVLRSKANAERALAALPHALVARVTGARKGALMDAAADDEACTALLTTIAGGRRIETRAGAIEGTRTSAFDDVVITGSSDLPKLPVRRTGADQSNTSVVFGERLILKLFRRFEAGPNPDVEIGAYLTERAGFTRVPALAGSIEYQTKGNPRASLAMLQQLVPSQANAWDHAVGEAGRYFERVEPRLAITDLPLIDVLPLEHADEPLPRIVLDTIGGYIESAGKLGRRTAELHLTLARNTTDPDFAPEPIAPGDLSRLAADMNAHAAAALDLLTVSRDRLPDSVRDAADHLLDQPAALRRHFDAVRDLAVDAKRIRVHGDYHLGQVLWAESDFVILDFEGEPARPLAERRAKQSPLKDVAGMLRSFSYAAYAALFAYTANRPELLDRLDPWAQVWQRHTSAVFLRTYFSTVESSAIVPANLHTLELLLRAFVLEKALYELQYELNNRPDWVRIPLRGIIPLLPRE